LVGDGLIAMAWCCGGNEHALGLDAHMREEEGRLVWGAAHGGGEEGDRLASEAHIGAEPEAMA
jgi:hypothetical protein